VRKTSIPLHHQHQGVGHIAENELLVQQSATEGVSLTNLSHDSGLTTSDSQLYAFEEGNNSFSSSDDLRDQRKMSAASRYSGGNGNYGDFTLPGQVPQTPSSNPSSKRSNHKTNHRDKIYRRLQKKEVTDNTLFNKYSGVVGGGHHPNVPGGGSDSAFVIDTTQLLLRRTASEESLAVNQMKDDSSPISAVSAHSARLARLSSDAVLLSSSCVVSITKAESLPPPGTLG
jgi:hypothetical protein